VACEGDRGVRELRDQRTPAGLEAKAKAEAEHRIDEVIAHGKRYAEQELREFEVFDRWEIRMEVEKALREEVRADWFEADVEELVDEVLDKFDHE
jgi:hypothetical protein